jgi:tetratricopeptide (TPR) repeat protein/transglutaminase-like putative cysteine protease
VVRCGTIISWFILGSVIVAAELTDVAAHPAQKTPAPAAQHKSPYDSREPYVIEEYRTVVRFENDGTSEQVLSARIRVQDEASAEKLSELIFPHNANEQVDVRSVRVRKADGRMAVAPPDAVKDAPAKSNTAAPAYSDNKEKHVTVPSLVPGDTLEYEVATRLTTPFAAGEFWFQHNFTRDAIVLDERLELNLPQGRAFSLRAPGYSVLSGKAAPAGSPSKDSLFSKTEENGRTLLRWKHSNLTRPAEDEQQRVLEEQKKPPDVQLTTFGSWETVARWYAHLEGDRIQPNAEIAARTAELIQGRTTNIEKIRSLYDYVSTNIRYVNHSFGLGPFQPATAAEVFKNQYGDSRDKHTLLAAMLAAAGIHADAALIPSVRKLDLALPSPSQFDHVVTAVPGSGSLIWLDSTPEVAPFRFLVASLRGKSALLISTEGSGKIVKTPADPPFLSAQRVEIDGAVSELGKLSGTIHYSLRGDTEFVLRTAFHRAPEAQWNQLAETILTLDGLHADVAHVTTSNPTDTHEPFKVDIEFSQSDFLDWSAKKTRVMLPLLTIGMPDPPADAKQMVELGSPLDVTTHLTLKLPPHFTAQPPIGVAVARDYAEFKASYRVENGVLSADRLVNFKIRELPAARAGDYVTFTRAVQADEGQTLSIENELPGPPEIPATAKADDLFDAGTAALKAGNLRAGIPLLERVTELDPKHQHAWNDLGLAYMRIGKFDEATASFRKQLEANPSDEHANDYLGLALEQQKRNDEAAAAFRRQIVLNPLDTIAHAALGTILLEGHQDADAVPELEKATILSPESAELEVSLGRAYLNTGATDKALEAFTKGVTLSPTPVVWNNVAYNLANHGVDLDDARKYAESAVKATAESLEKANLSRVAPSDFRQVSNLAVYWDTLGWVYFHRGDLQAADKYIRAAWLLSEDGSFGDHLAQIYEKLGQKDRAIDAYTLAMAAPHTPPETRARLILLLGGNAQLDDLVAKARDELAEMRTLSLNNLWKEDASADFLLLFSSKGIDEVKFVSGSQSLRPLADRLRAMHYDTGFPDAPLVKVVRRGTLSCSATGDCKFALLVPEDVHTVK